MKPINFLAVLCTMLFCCSAQAEFYIDNFTTLDAVGGGSTPIGSNGISVEISNSGGTTTVDNSLQQYQFLATTAGDSFTVSYDWTGLFDSLQSVSGNELSTIPVGLFGTWTMEVDTGASSTTIPATAALGSPIALDNATQLDFTFTYVSGSVFGFSGVTFGGASQPLFATPEPTAFFMLGTAGVILLSRRRRRV
jgi:hypothetical protein